MGFTFDVSGSQINGARDYQEDAFLITHLGDSDKPAEKASLVIVADGMGGHAAGNVASNMAVQTFNKYLTGNYPSDQMQTVLREAVFAANGSIEHTVKETEALKGMGCTFVGVIMHNTKMRWVSVGDSNLYLLRDKKLIKKNADHSYGGFLDRMAAAGTPVKPESGFSRNMLMSALTGEDIAEVDCPADPFEVKAGDRIIVSSDGLDSLSDAKIIHYCEGAKTAKDCVKALLDGVEEAKIPRQDNTTVVVIDVIAKEEKPAVAPPPPPPPVPAAPARALTVEEEQKLAITKYAPAGAPPIAIKPRPAPPPVEEAPEPKRNWLAIAAVIAGVLIVGGGAAYYFILGGGKSAVYVAAQKPKPEAAPSPEAPAPENAPPKEAAPTPPPAAAPAPQPKPAETAAAPATPAPAPAGNIEEFQDALKSGGAGPAMVWVPAGSFEMGAPSTAREGDERPRHAVQIGKKFAMSKYEITVAEFEKFAKAAGRAMPKLSSDFKPEHPMVMVSWEDALAYTHWLSEQTGFKYRLPSEAEWEYAAAAGTDSYEWWWGRDPGQGRAHCFGCGSDFDSRRPAKVGSFKPNPFGLYDTAGNVSEWVQDCFHNNYEGAPKDGSVWEGGDCNARVVRGGSYDQPPKSIRAAYRDKFNPAKANENIGIRIVREP